MIETLFSLGQLDTANGFFISLVAGVFFGIVLEQAGFGSSRRLAGVFYFKDMAVIKVMFTAMITAIICLQLCFGFGWISGETVYLNPTIYSAQIIGGIIFGIGFVMGGWCPGTAAVGAASGKLDALIFLGGAVLGSAFFNELYVLVNGLYQGGTLDVAFVYDSLGVGREWFVLLFVSAGVLVFWGVELIEKKTTGQSAYLNTPFLKQFSVIGVVAGFFAFLVLGSFPASQTKEAAVQSELTAAFSPTEQSLLAGVEEALDHMEPEELADKISSGFQDLILVDIRPRNEFMNFHIRTARNIGLSELAEQLAPFKNRKMIILYSNGMTHPAQARDSLFRQGFQHVYFLTDGLEGFIERCLRPVSLRTEPVPEPLAARINQWRGFFLDTNGSPEQQASPPEPMERQSIQPDIVDASRLAGRLTDERLAVIDLRSQPEYNTAHIPGSYALNIESLRGNLYGVPSCLLPADMLSGHLSLMGITPETRVVLVHGDRVQDATLAAMALERLGHMNYSILSGGFAGWKEAGMITDTRLPQNHPSSYPSKPEDTFTIDYETVLSYVKAPGTAVILDVRPTAYYTGEKSDEARAGHIPGAVNRPFDTDTIKTGDMLVFRSVSELETAYMALIPSKQDLVVVHCRTGHQASQTFLVLKRLLGYERVLWYDAGWTQWAAMPQLPVNTGETP